MRQGIQRKGGGGGGIRLSEIQQDLSLVCLASPAVDCEVETGFASDVLSDVLARAPKGCVLVTMQTNINVVAVASYAGIAGVIVTSGHRPAAEILARAAEEGIGVYCTPADTFDVVGRLALMGLKGRQDAKPHQRGAVAPGGEDEKLHG